MEERRKSRRLELSAKLLLKRLDQEGEAEEVSIDVMDVSKGGIGFRCTEPLEIGSVYESLLTIWTKEVLHAFIEIVRTAQKGDGSFEYGGIFIGMPEIAVGRIETYSTIEILNERKNSV